MDGARPTPLDGLDFASESFLTNPWPIYAHLRAHDPVHWSERNKSFFLFRYEHVREALSSSDYTVDFPLRASRLVFGPTLLDTDGPAHRAMRRIVGAMFNTRAVELQLPAIIETIVTGVLDRVDGDGPIDFVQDVAVQVPYGTICHLMGMPVEDVAWLYDRMRPVVRSLDIPRGDLPEALHARKELEEYLSGIVASKRARPDGTLLGMLARSGDADLLVEDREVLSTSLLFLLAGTETSICAIANILVCLLLHPEAVRAIRERPETIPSVIAECLRWEPPLHSVLRFAAVDLDVDGVAIPHRAPVHLSLASANRDEAHFHTPDVWEPGRAEKHHLTFGAGRHGCMGATLAEREFGLVYRLLAERCDELEVDGEIPPIRGHAFRRPERLWLTIRRRG